MRRNLKWSRGSTGIAGRGLRPMRWGKLAAVGVLAVALLPATASGENGNIAPNAINVQDADLYPAPATQCDGFAFDETPGTETDWVKDCLENTTDFVISGANQNAAAQKGHLNGFRVTDGVAGADQDIFLTGGKENDLTTWNPGPGSVGSSKYDITQAYIANNTEKAFFGMERRGNNGTTAFDWEFNRKPPVDPTPNNPNDPLYIPTRSECDVLVTFEMQGSGGSGSADPFVFRWNDPDVNIDCSDGAAVAAAPADTDKNGSFVSASTAGIVTSINEAAKPSAPWGTVDSHGDWTTDPIDRFKFAEASVPLSTLGIGQEQLCSAVSRYTQVRTRSSSTPNSDLKDLTKIFSFDFFAPVNPTQTTTTNCSAQFTFASSLQTGSPTWTFSIPDTGGQATPITLAGVNPTTVSAGTHANGKTSWTSSGLSGTVQVGNFPQGVNSVAINVAQSTQDGNGCNTGSTGQVTVYRTQSGLATASVDCDGKITYTADVSGGKAPYDLVVELQSQNGDGTWTTRKTDTYNDDADGSVATTTATAFDGSANPGTWRVHVTSTDSQTVGPNGGGCVITFDSATFQVRAPLSATAAKDQSTTVGSTLTAGLDGAHTGALAGDTVTYQWQRSTDGQTWTNISGKTTEDTTYNAFKTDATPANVDFTIASGAAAESYKGRLWTIQLRLKVTRTVGTQVCDDFSDALELKVVEGVDP